MTYVVKIIKASVPTDFKDLDETVVRREQIEKDFERRLKGDSMIDILRAYLARNRRVKALKRMLRDVKRRQLLRHA